MMKGLGDELLSCVCDYLDVSSLHGLYDSYNAKDLHARDVLGSSLRSIHTGILSHESTNIDCEAAISCLDDQVTFNGFPQWIWTSQSIRSIKVFFPVGIDSHRTVNILKSLSSCISSGNCCGVESLILIVSTLGDQVYETIQMLIRNVIDACKLGKLISFREFHLNFEEMLWEWNMDNGDLSALKQYCPLLQSFSVSFLAFGDDGPGDVRSAKLKAISGLKWNSLVSLDVSGLLGIFYEACENLDECIPDVIKYLSCGLFPSLTKITYRNQDTRLQGVVADTFLQFITGCYEYLEAGGLEFFGSKIRTLELDSMDLDPAGQYGCSQEWVELRRRVIHMNDMGRYLPLSGELFPDLEVLKCNHWLPCAQLLSLFCGTRKINSTRVPLKLEVSPGIEDPFFSSFLTNLWVPEHLPIKSLLIRRKRRLVPFALSHFCDDDIGYLDEDSDPLLGGPDSRPQLLQLDRFQNEYVECLEFVEPMNVDDAITQAMVGGKLRGVEELGLGEIFLYNHDLFSPMSEDDDYDGNGDGNGDNNGGNGGGNGMEENGVERYMSLLFANCCGLKRLVIYPESELRFIPCKSRVMKFVAGIVVLLSSIRRESERTRGGGGSDNAFPITNINGDSNNNTNNNDDNNNENKNDRKRSKIEIVVIDAPSKLFYTFLREQLLDILESEIQDPVVGIARGMNDDRTLETSVENESNKGGGKEKKDKNSNKNENRNRNKNENQKKLIVRIVYGSQSRTFLWSDHAGNILKRTQRHLREWCPYYEDKIDF